MNTLIDILNTTLPLMYVGLVWVYGKAFFSDLVWAKRAKTPLLVATTGFHGLYLLLRTLEFHHPPATTIFEILTLLAFSISVIYLVIETRSRAKETGYFILNMALFFQVGSSLFIKDLVEVPQVLQSNLFGLHVTAAILGYSAISISAVYSLLYLMLYHEIKVSRFGVVYRKLPNLETLETMSISAIGLAVILLAVSMVAGFVWLPQAFTNVSYADPKLVGTVVVWLLYVMALVLKRTGELKGRKVMILALSGFAISIFSLTVINVFFSGFHNFY